MRPSEEACFGLAYARARELQADAWSEELAELREKGDMDPQVRRATFAVTK
jgi:hypothetical protein